MTVTVSAAALAGTEAIGNPIVAVLGGDSDSAEIIGVFGHELEVGRFIRQV